MSTNLLIFACCFNIVIITCIFYLVVKKQISYKFAIVWILLFFILFLFIIIPGLLNWFTQFLGFQTPSNMILCILIAILILISIASTVAITRRSKDVVSLTQELAILKKMIEDKKDLDLKK